MTTIVCADGVMASDSLVTDDAVKFEYQKIHKLDKKGVIIGTCGDFTIGLSFIKWFADRRRAQPDVGDDFEALVLHKNGVIETWDSTFTPVPWPPDKPMAVGSGAGPALAALYCGKDATEAVEIACRVDPCSGGPITTLSW